MPEPRRFALLVVIGILAGYAWWRYDHRDGRRAPEKFTPAAASKLKLDDVKILTAIDAEYAKLVESVVPSVVSITSSRTVMPPWSLSTHPWLLPSAERSSMCR